MLEWLSGIYKNQGRSCGSCVLLLFALLSSCNSSKYLSDEQYLLKSQQIKLLDAKQIADQGDLRYELLRLSEQQPPSKFLFLFPRTYFYLANNKAGDTTGLDKVLRNTFGAPPVFYDEAVADRAAENMKTYLQYLGYLEAEVYHEVNRQGNAAKLTYYARPEQQTIIRQLHYQSSQAAIDSLLQVVKTTSLLAVGQPLDVNVLSKERDRVVNFLRNQGYAYINTAAFDQLEVDTFGLRNEADIYLRLLPPKGAKEYTRYRIGKVEVYPDYSLSAEVAELPDSIQNLSSPPFDTIVEGIHFSYQKGFIELNPATLLDNIFLRPGEYFSIDKYNQSNTQLGQLGLFNFVRISPKEDSLGRDLLHYVIQLPAKQKIELATSLDVSYTNRATTGADNLIGFGLNPSFTNRNLFGGAQLLVVNLNASLEIDPNTGSDTGPDVGRPNRFFNTLDLGADASIYLPRFRDLLGVYGLSKGLLSKNFYQNLQSKANTRFSVGFERLLIRDFYAFTQANARFGYNLNPSAVHRYTINHAALDLLRPTIEPLFQERLDNNEFLRRSFGQQYFVSLLFRDLNYQRLGRTDRRGRSLNFTGYIEASGWELGAINSIFKSKERPAGLLDSSNNLAQYLRLRLDSRFYKKYSDQSSFASRFMFSIARPFGNDKDVPYVKQFSVGGANSMRAWAPRGLGPGGHLDSLSLPGNRGSNFLLYQTGDLHVELNLEYRYKLFSFVKGALFLDIGNVWTLDRDAERCGSQFRFSATSYECGGGTFFHQPFYKQLAVGAGTGLRMDLSYFIFRLDVSVPLRFNYPSERPADLPKIPENLYWNRFSSRSVAQSMVWQLGLGYPF